MKILHNLLIYLGERIQFLGIFLQIFNLYTKRIHTF